MNKDEIKEAIIRCLGEWEGASAAITFGDLYDETCWKCGMEGGGVRIDLERQEFATIITEMIVDKKVKVIHSPLGRGGDGFNLRLVK